MVSAEVLERWGCLGMFGGGLWARYPRRLKLEVPDLGMFSSQPALQSASFIQRLVDPAGLASRRCRLPGSGVAQRYCFSYWAMAWQAKRRTRSDLAWSSNEQKICGRGRERQRRDQKSTVTIFQFKMGSVGTKLVKRATSPREPLHTAMLTTKMIAEPSSLSSKNQKTKTGSKTNGTLWHALFQSANGHSTEPSHYSRIQTRRRSRLKIAVHTYLCWSFRRARTRWRCRRFGERCGAWKCCFDLFCCILCCVCHSY